MICTRTRTRGREEDYWTRLIGSSFQRDLLRDRGIGGAGLGFNKEEHNKEGVNLKGYFFERRGFLEREFCFGGCILKRGISKTGTELLERTRGHLREWNVNFSIFSRVCGEGQLLLFFNLAICPDGCVNGSCDKPNHCKYVSSSLLLCILLLRPRSYDAGRA